MDNISAEDINSGRFVFNDIFHVFKYLRESWNIGWYAASNFEVMELGKHGDNRVVAAPKPFSPLFRGQNTFYRKCYPSLFRKEWSIPEELERLVQMEDFKVILDDNPEIQDMLKSGLQVNYNGLAQHYGIETNIIDLTNSFGVAAFFATSDYDSENAIYKPIEETYRQGVIYFLPTGMFSNLKQGLGYGDDDDDYAIWPIGLEALPRPGEQRGFGAHMKKGVDFNTIEPCRFFFRQNKSSSLMCQESFKWGKMLFPDDPMVAKVKNMRKDRIYGKDSVRKVVESRPDLHLDEENAMDILTKNGCKLVETTPFKYTQEELSYITDRYHKMYPDSFS